MNGSPYIVMPGARIGVENGHLVESLGQSHLAGITGPPTYGIGSGIGVQAMAGGACCPPCAQGEPCATGESKGGAGGALFMFGILIAAVAFLPKMLK